MQRNKAYVLIAVGVVFTFLVGLSGCASSLEAPTHQRPEVVAKSSWSMEIEAGPGHEIDASWWESFGDPQLNALVERAIDENQDLKVLAARTELARTQIGQAQALRLPTFAGGIRTDTTDITNLGTSNKYGTGGEMAWELDVWGKAKKGVQAQEAEFQATRADWRAGHLTIVSTVIDGYFQIRQLDRQLGQQRKSEAQNERILELYRKLYLRGLAPETQVTRQEAELHAIRAARRDLERARALAENSLASVVGAPPGEFEVADTSERAVEALPLVPAGLPADLLARRPDLLAAEYRLLSQVHLEGQARRAQLPRIGLTSIGGSASFGLKDILSTWTAGLSSVLQFPVFDPDVRARIPVSEAEVKVAEEQYRAAVMRAFEEVEGVLINLQLRRQQRSDLLARSAKLDKLNALSHRQLELGLVSHLDVLEQERSMLAAEQALIENEWLIASDTVALYRAIGGGWPEETPGADAAVSAR